VNRAACVASLRFQRRRVRRDYLGLLIWRGIIHPHEETSSAQGIRQFPLSVRGDHHNRPMLRDNRTQLRNRNLKIERNLKRNASNEGPVLSLHRSATRPCCPTAKPSESAQESENHTIELLLQFRPCRCDPFWLLWRMNSNAMRCKDSFMVKSLASSIPS